MKIWLRLVYAKGDVAATLLRPWRWSYAFVALLYPFYIESEIPIRFYYDLGGGGGGGVKQTVQNVAKFISESEGPQKYELFAIFCDFLPVRLHHARI